MGFFLANIEKALKLIWFLVYRDKYLKMKYIYRLYKLSININQLQ